MSTLSFCLFIYKWTMIMTCIEERNHDNSIYLSISIEKDWPIENDWQKRLAKTWMVAMFLETNCETHHCLWTDTYITFMCSLGDVKLQYFSDIKDLNLCNFLCHFKLATSFTFEIAGCFNWCFGTTTWWNMSFLIFILVIKNWRKIYDVIKLLFLFVCLGRRGEGGTEQW